MATIFDPLIASVEQTLTAFGEPDIASDVQAVTTAVSPLLAVANRFVSLFTTTSGAPDAVTSTPPPRPEGGSGAMGLIVLGGLILALNWMAPSRRRRHRRNPSRSYTSKTIRSPRYFDPRSFRTVTLPDGRLVTIGCRKGEWSAKLERCLTGMRAQRVLTPRYAKNAPAAWHRAALADGMTMRARFPSGTPEHRFWEGHISANRGALAYRSNPVVGPQYKSFPAAVAAVNRWRRRGYIADIYKAGHSRWQIETRESIRPEHARLR